LVVLLVLFLGVFGRVNLVGSAMEGIAGGHNDQLMRVNWEMPFR
jgi:hypothetical protein